MEIKKLHQIFKKYGSWSIQYKNKCIGLLPAIYKNKVHEKYGMSIFEYAAKFAGISNEQVRVTLRLDERFENKPALHQLLESGEVSINKLVRVATIATAENESFWAEKIKILPKAAIETLVKDFKSEDRNGLPETKNWQDFLPGQEINFSVSNIESLNGMNELKNIKLEADVIEALSNLQVKGIDINQLIREMIQNRKFEIAKEKEQLMSEMKTVKKFDKNVSRYIPVKVKQILQKEHGLKCSMDNCFKMSEIIHHTKRFALAKSEDRYAHDPKFLAPLCKEHHNIAHSIDLKFQRIRTEAIG